MDAKRTSLQELLNEAAAQSIELSEEQRDALLVGAEVLARTARARGISQYDQVETALIRAMGPALAYFSFSERPRAGRIADLGAGNGALGAAIALIEPDVTVDLLDRAERSYTACELLVKRMRLQNAACVLASIDKTREARYDGVVFRALAQSARALELAHAITRPGGFIGAWHASGDAGYLEPPGSLRLLRTVGTLVPDLVLTGYRT